MSGLGFLLIALVLSVLGSIAIWLRQRPPTSMDHGIDEFQREMKALAPERWRRPVQPPE
jgi:hypothetical protein